MSTSIASTKSLCLFLISLVLLNCQIPKQFTLQPVNNNITKDHSAQDLNLDQNDTSQDALLPTTNDDGNILDNNTAQHQQLDNQSIDSNITTTNDSKIACEQTQYTSQYTRCQITFDFCNSTHFKFLKCQKKKCGRYIRASDCRLEVRIVLEEQACYKECCGAYSYNQMQCNAYNNKKQGSDEKWQLVVIIGTFLCNNSVIIGSALIILIVVAYLMIKKQKCCKNQYQTRNLKKYSVCWKSDTLQESQGYCETCSSYGAELLTPCDHAFHISCFQKTAEEKPLPLCPKCQKVLQDRIKISCSLCKDKAFKIKLWKLEHLPDIMAQARSLHNQICQPTGRSDQRLLIT